MADEHSHGSFFSFLCGKTKPLFSSLATVGTAAAPHSTAPSVGLGRSIALSRSERPLIMDTAPRTAPVDAGRLQRDRHCARCNRCSRTSIKIKYRIFTCGLAGQRELFVRILKLQVTNEGVPLQLLHRRASIATTYFVEVDGVSTGLV